MDKYVAFGILVFYGLYGAISFGFDLGNFVFEKLKKRDEKNQHE